MFKLIAPAKKNKPDGFGRTQSEASSSYLCYSLGGIEETAWACHSVHVCTNSFAVVIYSFHWCMHTAAKFRPAPVKAAASQLRSHGRNK